MVLSFGPSVYLFRQKELALLEVLLTRTFPMHQSERRIAGGVSLGGEAGGTTKAALRHLGQSKYLPQTRWRLLINGKGN